MMDFWKSIAGMVEVELTSAEPGTAFGVIAGEDIPIFDVRQISELTSRFQIYRRDLGRLTALSEKRGETLKLCHRKGMFWTAKRLIKRPVLLLGMVILLCMVFYLPSRVFFIRVEGNATVPTKRILAAAEESGICFGASRREVRSEKMKNALLSAVPELQWAGVNTAGCVATISVRERTDSQQKEQEAGVSSIVAARDGLIYSCTVTKGNALVSVGQTVREGQVLVSGYTDCGICIQATSSEGEIFAQTRREITAVTLAEGEGRGTLVASGKKYSLLIGKKRINLWKDSGIWDTSCGRMYEEYYITLPGGFQLPVALCIEEYTCYETETVERTLEDAEEALTLFADSYIKEQMIAGSILDKAQNVIWEDGVYRLEGDYVCGEMIGRVKREQIGEVYGKNS